MVVAIAVVLLSSARAIAAVAVVAAVAIAFGKTFQEYALRDFDHVSATACPPAALEGNASLAITLHVAIALIMPKDCS